MSGARIARSQRELPRLCPAVKPDAATAAPASAPVSPDTISTGGFAPIADCFTSLERAPGVEPVDTAGTAGFSTSGRAVVARLVPTTANDADLVMAFVAAEGLE